MLTRLLVPHDARFFVLFNRGIQNTLEGARVLVDVLEHGEDIDRKARHLKAIEHAGDEITQEVFRALNRTFVTPLDREDIGALASAVDDVIEWVEEAARRIRLYHVQKSTPLARQLGCVILDQVEELARAVPRLERREYGDLHRTAQRVHSLENVGDDLLAEALGSLYGGVPDVPQVIHAMRWADIYQVLEEATDKAEHVAVVLQNIAWKQA